MQRGRSLEQDHVTDVAKPLASVSRILDKGNTVVFSRTKGGSYILNEKTG